jgi:hypothetical protein
LERFWHGSQRFAKQEEKPEACPTVSLLALEEERNLAVSGTLDYQH